MKGIEAAFFGSLGKEPELKTSESRDALLTAIAKARSWIDDLRLGRLASFREIAEREGQGERHIRLLAPLAFVSPRSLQGMSCPSGQHCGRNVSR